MDARPALVGDIMVQNAVSVTPGALLYDAAKLMNDNRMPAVPVISGDGVLVGILDDRSLVSKGSALHVPTLQFIARNMSIQKTDKNYVYVSSREAADLDTLIVQDVMNPPVFFYTHTPIEEAVFMFANDPKILLLPVVDKDKRVVGIVRPAEVLKLIDYDAVKNILKV